MSTMPADGPPLRRVGFKTSLGTIPVIGLAGAFAPSGKLAVLTITGVAAKSDDMIRIPITLAPEFDGFVAALPGNNTPNLTETSIEAFGRAFDEVVEQLDRPVVVFGISVGGLVALAMRRPRAMVAVDPPLDTGKTWPLAPVLTSGLPDHREFLDKVLGYTEAGLQGRRYHHLLDGLAAPVEVVLGEDPLFPMRETTRYPSLVDEPERALMAAHPMMTVSVAPNTGHDVPRQAVYFLFERLLAACRAVDG